MGKCGLCEYSKYADGEFWCCNEESDLYGLETDYSECCTEYEPKDGEDE